MISPFNLSLKGQDAFFLEKIVVSNLRKSPRTPNLPSGISKLDCTPSNRMKKDMKTKTNKFTLNLGQLTTSKMQLSPLEASPTFTTKGHATDRLPSKTPVIRGFALSMLQNDQSDKRCLNPRSSSLPPTVLTFDKGEFSHDKQSPRNFSGKLKKIQLENPLTSRNLLSKMPTSMLEEFSNMRETDSGGFFVENTKKYKIRIPSFPLYQRTTMGRSKEDPQLLQHKANLELYRKVKIKSHKLDKKPNLMGEDVTVNKRKEGWTEDEENKVNLLKKKMEIFGKFYPPNSSDERKRLYKQLIFEYHPDKTRHPKEFSGEIFTFLHNNKHKFLN